MPTPARWVAGRSRAPLPSWISLPALQALSPSAKCRPARSTSHQSRARKAPHAFSATSKALFFPVERIIQDHAAFSRKISVGLLSLAFALIAAPAAAQTHAATVVASDFNNPRDPAFGPGGALYIAETGFMDPSFPPSGTSGFSSSLDHAGSGRRAVADRDGPANDLQSGLDETTGPQGIAFDASGSRYVAIEGLERAHVGKVLEPATWAMMIAALGAIGVALRRSKQSVHLVPRVR